MKKKPIIIDCDPGVDDTFAIFYALADETLDVKLITTVSGNVDVDKTTLNAQRIVAMAGNNVEIARGAERPLIAEPIYAYDIHGNNGMGDYVFKEDIFAPLSDRPALEAMANVLQKSEEKVVICPIGPLTNIAQLLMLYPKLKEKIDFLSIMGGSLKGGNTNAAAEFNFLADPEAANIVFNSGVPIIMAGLDVTEKAYIDKSHLDRIRSTGKIGSFLAEMIVKARKNIDGENFELSLHDVVSIIAVNNLNLFDYEELKVVIETQGLYTRGMSLADRRILWREEGDTKVLIDLDHHEFINLLCKKLESYH